jgi:hypothetical protein
MASIIPGAESINFTPIINQGVYWLGIILFGVAILAGLWFVWHMTTFKIKATIFPLYGSGKDGVFAVGKPKSNKVRWTRDRMAWNKMFPFMNQKEIEPFDSEYIYPGNHIYVYELGDIWIPGRININLEEDAIRAGISPVPVYIRNWQSIVHKRNAEKYAKIDFWTQNKEYLVALGVIIACCVLVGVTIYFTFKFAGGKADAMVGLTEAIKNMNMIKGVAPG